MPQRAEAYRGSRLKRLVFYRNRAEEIRVLAAGVTDSTRKTLLDIAAAYDMLAAELPAEMETA